MQRSAPWWIAACSVAAFLAMAFGDIVSTSPVYDEPAHLAAGWSYLKTGDFRLNPEHPPLVKSIAALPMTAMNVWPPTLHDDGTPAATSLLEAWGTAASASWGQWFFAHRLFYACRDRDIAVAPTTEPIPRSALLNNPERIFTAARTTLLIVFGLSLAAVIFFWSRALWGAWGAALSLALFCFDPNFIAHAPLVTTDVAISLFYCATFMFLWRFCETGSRWSAAGLIASIALAHVAKFSGVLLWPIVIIAGVIACRSRFRRLMAIVAIAIAATWLTIWAAYGFTFNAARRPLPTEEVVKTWYEKKGATDIGFLGRSVLFANEHHLVPEAYLHGFAIVQRDAIDRGSYLNGKIASSGFASYFFWTTLFKVPVATLVLMTVGVVAAIRRRPMLAAFSFLPAVVYLAVSIQAHLNIGHRHILPMFPLLYVMAGSLPRRLLPIATLSAIACLFTLGSHLAYFNELAGGTRNGYKHLIDSNLDWGQDLERLGKWVAAKKIREPINLIYPGSGEPRYYGITYVNIEGAFVPAPRATFAEARLPGLVAVSTNAYVFGPWGQTRFYRDFLTKIGAKEIDRVGATITIYEVR